MEDQTNIKEEIDYQWTIPSQCPHCESEDYSPVAEGHPHDKCNKCGTIWHDR